MNNKLVLKKYFIITLTLIVVFNILFYFINKIEYTKYQENYNNKINSIIEVLENKNIDKNEIVSILNNTNSSKNNLKEYGIDLKKDSVILKNKKDYNKYVILNIILLTSFLLVMLAINLIYLVIKNIKYNEITNYLKNLNKKIYDLDIDNNSEDELSILKNEIYKITIMLKETNENLYSDKISLKNSLEDISHQLKTPLTAINILIDNILENDIDEVSRRKFIIDIKREISNINFLVLNILKLSKFDSNTIEFNKKMVSIDKIISESIKKLEPLIDLKESTIKYKKTNIKINCDYIWEIEAITNIIKNAIEYSNKIDIAVSENNIYTKLTIKDYGKGMDLEDQKNIFKRFYKGKNSNKESFGIGLSLSKSIIEKDNGKISVESRLNEGTTFIIKYYKNEF